MNVVKKSKEYVKKLLQEKLRKELSYHNLEHTIMVYESCVALSKLAELEEEERDILLVAALFHDTGFATSTIDHERHSQAIAKKFLTKLNVDDAFIDRVNVCIEATKLGNKTTDRLALFLQDADMSGLAHQDYTTISERLRKENNALGPEEVSKKKWLRINVNFLESCTYKTEEGRHLYQDKKQANLAKILNDGESKENEKLEEDMSISDSKTAQTQFKTALRNHIDLSNIADNKANIMISVNALILTVALPLMIEKSMGNYVFWIATITLAIVCLASMIFATLATRPISMLGKTTEDQVMNNKSNLFFFGNYYNMDFGEYLRQIKLVVKDEKKLEDSIISDLFYIGKSLGKKYNYLRLCYSFFMYGIGASVLALFIAYFIK